jgi:hypothetical protein
MAAEDTSAPVIGEIKEIHRTYLISMKIAEGYEVEGADISDFNKETNVLEVLVECKRREPE